MAKASGHYRFRKHDNIGANDAENDDAFLSTCFEDTGDVAVLLDCNNPKRIVLGRTGAGKSALLLELGRKSDKVIEVHPEELSFNYLTNSTILPYLTALGVNLDPFYKLLWRHVFAVTIIQNRIDIVDSDKQRSFIGQITDWFSNKQVKSQKIKTKSAGKRHWNTSTNGEIDSSRILNAGRNRSCLDSKKK